VLENLEHCQSLSLDGFGDVCLSVLDQLCYLGGFMLILE